MYYVYNGFYVFDFIAHYWATFSALCALLSSRIMTNKDDDDDDDFLFVFNRNYASILYRYRNTASYLSKFANFDLPYHTCIWHPRWL